jgi:hypothetical protein
MYLKFMKKPNLLYRAGDSAADAREVWEVRIVMGWRESHPRLLSSQPIVIYLNFFCFLDKTINVRYSLTYGGDILT